MSTANDKGVLAAPTDQLFGEHRDPEEIKKEIHEAAAEVAETLDALHAKLTPEIVAEEVKHVAFGKIEEAKEHLLATAKAYPNVTTLLALGGLWVIGRNIFGQGRGSGVVSLAIGASIGVVVYRAMNGTLVQAPVKRVAQRPPERDVNLAPGLPLQATLE